MNEKVQAALKVLQVEGYSFKLLPEKLEIHVGRLDIHNQGRQERGPISGRHTEVKIDGNDISAMLQEWELRVAVEEIVSFDLKLRGIV